jgi:hypothetical protein
MLSLLAAFALLGGALFLSGCSSTSALAGPAAAGTAGLTVNVDWQAAAGSRMIPSWTNTIEVEVNAPDMLEPVTATITRPDTSATLGVPIGAGRVVTLYGLDINGTRTASMGQATGVKVFPRQSNSVSILLGGQEDYSGTPVAITLDSTATAGTKASGAGEAVIEMRNGQGSGDYFTFNGVGGQQYTITFVNLEQTIYDNASWTDNANGLNINAMSQVTGILGNTATTKSAGDASQFADASLNITATEDGPINISVYPGWPSNQSWALYYRITVTESGDANVTVNAD